MIQIITQFKRVKLGIFEIKTLIVEIKKLIIKIKRGLGFTGGTLDKLESIPSFRVHQQVEQIEDIIERIGY